MSAPSADHPIAVVANPHRVRVIHQGVTYADTQHALTLNEANLPAVQYLPRADVNMARMERSDHRTYCPYKGDASYFHLKTEDGLIENVAWSYEQPFDHVASIAGYIAFYPSRIDQIEQTS
jgi:uncharacterized protein (DUF427 family)